MKNFFVGALRLATALFMAGLALALIAAIFIWGHGLYQRHEASKYETAKEWESDLRDNLGLLVQARTKVLSGKLLLSITVIGNPPYLNDPRTRQRNQNAHLLFHFTDSDGFRIISKSVEIAEFSSVVNDKGETIGMRTQQEDFITVEDYRRLQKMQMEWTLQTEIPPELPSPAPEAKAPLDHCAPKLSRKERLRRLSEFGDLRETGENMYSAGDHYVHFFYDGSLMNCQ